MTAKEIMPSINARVPLEVVASIVSSHFGLEERELFERTRKRNITDKRFMFFSLVRDYNHTNIRLHKIGKYCTVYYGIKSYDHTTVLHGTKKIRELYKLEIDIKYHYDAITAKIDEWLKVHGEYNYEFQQTKGKIVRDIVTARSMSEIHGILKEGNFSYA